MLDKAGHPQIINSVASRHLSDDGLLYLDSNGVLRSRNAKLDRALRDSVSAPDEMRTPTVARVDDDGHPMAAWVSVLQGDGSDPAVYVMLMNNAPREVSGELLSDMLEITRAEGRLVRQLMAGKSLMEYAREADLSYNTVRNQLRSIMAKTQASSQMELLVMVHRLLPPLHLRA